jgi:hypothetical protein
MEAIRERFIRRRSCGGIEKPDSHRRGYGTAKVLALGLIILLLGPLAITEPAAAKGHLSFHKIKVMTQNLYIGADIFAPLEGPIDELPLRVAETFAEVMQSNFPARAEAIAKIVARKRPDLIGLQEVFLLRQGPADFLVNLLVNAEDEVENGDYLSILLEKLRDRGLHYYVAASVENTDVELPMLVGFDGEGMPQFRDLRVTDHDVILARRGTVTFNEDSRHYETLLEFSFDLGGTELIVEAIRGYVAVDARVRGELFHIVNTHLEGRGKDLLPPGDPMIPIVSSLQAAQAQELIESLAYEPLPVIVLGDLNSDPGDPIIPESETGLGFPIVPPYKQFVLSGYRDIWLTNLFGLWKDDIEGPTCCQDENLQNVESALSERIDFVFVRNTLGSLPFSVVGPVFAVVVGDEEHDKTDTDPPLWPSDHGGVAATMFIPTLKGRPYWAGPKSK